MFQKIYGLLRGVPESNPATASEPDPATATASTRPSRYVRGCDLTDGQIDAGLASGELAPWRIGGDGEPWYERSTPVINGIAPAEDVDTDDTEDDDAPAQRYWGDDCDDAEEGEYR